MVDMTRSVSWCVPTQSIGTRKDPVRRGYVDDPASWIYSSARNFMNNDNSILELDHIMW
ncbi:MAG: hypothetical protein ACUBOA_08495 [Candidatus Loosdrechtia sp.]|uniref:hypothetical protein n=1 Tax=Candidatus Loosdrechtia sp. TaxID=3101272 RepID=UPI003A6978BD|nr:MAG: hypothetical protein QY305_08755 [Candidatus Jettenia sp. AMX2]